MLSLPEEQAGAQDFDGRVLRLAEDLAFLSANPDHLAGACAQLASLDQPAVVSPAPSRALIRMIDCIDHDRPARLLEGHSEHRRVQALAALATNPHTPHAAVADVLHVLHPAGLAWIAEKVEGPEWFLNTAAAVPSAETVDDGVLRQLNDDELSQHPDPAAVLQSWPDSPAADEILPRQKVLRMTPQRRDLHRDPDLTVRADAALKQQATQTLSDRYREMQAFVAAASTHWSPTRTASWSGSTSTGRQKKPRGRSRKTTSPLTDANETGDAPAGQLWSLRRLVPGSPRS